MEPDLPINSSAAGGPAQGNYMPSAFGSLIAQQQRAGSTNLMEAADTYNPATLAIQRAAARGMSGAGTSYQLNEYINQTRAGFAIQQGARAVQGMFGHGSFTDLAYGAQQMIGGGGIRMGMGIGGSQMIAGGGMVTDALAKRTFDRLNNYYFDERGMARNSNTMGRDNAGLSRAMQIVAASGQLSGTEAFTFGKLSVTERLHNLYGDMKASGRGNDASAIRDTILRIKNGGMNETQAAAAAEQLMKSAAGSGRDALSKGIKASVLDTDSGFKESPQFAKVLQGQMKQLMKLHDTMKDIFGDVSDLESLTMGSQITGISANGAGAFAKIRSGMEKIRGDAAALGVGAAPYAQAVGQFGGMYGQALGSSGMGGVMASMYAPSFYRSARDSQDAVNANGRGRVYKEQDIASEHVRDTTDYSRESGATAATQLLYKTAFDPSVKGNPALVAEINAAVRAHGNAQVGPEKAETTKRLMALLDKTGMENLSNSSMMSALADTPQGNRLAEMSAAGVNRSFGHLYAKRARDIGGASTNPLGAGYSDNAGSILLQLHSTLGLKEGDDISKLLASGKSSEAYALIDKNSAYFRSNGIDPETLKGKISSGASGTRGGMEAFGKGLVHLSNNLNTSGENMNLAGQKQKMLDTQNSAFKALMEGQVGEGSLDSSMSRVLADLFVSGGNQTKVSTRDVAAYAVARGKTDDQFTLNSNNGTLNFSEAQLDKWSGNKELMEQLGLANKGELAAYVADPGHTTGLLSTFNSLGYSTVGGAVGGKSGLHLLSEGTQEDNEKQMSAEARKKYFQNLGVSLSSEELNRLNDGRDVSEDPKRLREFEAAKKGKLWDKVSKNTVNASKWADANAVQRGQNVKDALYHKDAAGAGYMLQALQTEGVLTDHQRYKLFKNLQNDDKLKDHLSGMGIDTTGFKDDQKSWDIIQQGLAKIAGVEYKSKAGGAPGQAGQVMPSLTVQHMTVLKHS